MGKATTKAEINIDFENTELEQREEQEETEFESSQSAEDYNYAKKIYSQTCKELRSPLSKAQEKIKSKLSEKERIFASDILVRRACLCVSKRKFDEALPNFRMALKIFDCITRTCDGNVRWKVDQSFVKILLRMATIHTVRKSNKLALQCYEKAIYKTNKLLLYLKNNSVSITNVNELIDISNSELSNLFLRLGILNEKMGNFLKSLKSFSEALRVKRLERDVDKMKESGIMMRIGNVLSINEDHDQAMKYFQHALTIRLNLLGDDDPLIADLYNKIAKIFNVKGSLKDAHECCQESLDILGCREDKKSELMLAETHHNLGVLYMKKGSVNESMKHFSIALRIKEEMIGKENESVAETLQCMAELHYSVGDFEESIELNKDALCIKEIILGRNHYSVAPTLNNLGSSYLKLNDCNMAISCHRRALRIFQNNMRGITHSAMGIALNGIGLAHKKNGDFNEAMNYFSDALDVCRSAGYTPDNPVVLSTVRNIASFEYYV